ncbi:hypothetical protein ACU686_05685 [Yinghuangia aomiensis]
MQFAVGHYEFVTSKGPDGVQIRDAVPPDLVASTVRLPGRSRPHHLRWLSAGAGPLPLRHLRPAGRPHRPRRRPRSADAVAHPGRRSGRRPGHRRTQHGARADPPVVRRAASRWRPGRTCG